MPAWQVMQVICAECHFPFLYRPGEKAKPCPMCEVILCLSNVRSEITDREIRWHSQGVQLPEHELRWKESIEKVLDALEEPREPLSAEVKAVLDRVDPPKHRRIQ